MWQNHPVIMIHQHIFEYWAKTLLEIILGITGGNNMNIGYFQHLLNLYLKNSQLWVECVFGEMLNYTMQVSWQSYQMLYYDSLQNWNSITTLKCYHWIKNIFKIMWHLAGQKNRPNGWTNIKSDWTLMSLIRHLKYSLMQSNVIYSIMMKYTWQFATNLNATNPIHVKKCQLNNT